MANTTTGRVLRWEAADTTGIVGTLHIAAWAWVSTDGTNRDIAADDDLTVTDQDGLIVLEKRAEAAGDGIDPTGFPQGAMTFNGIKVTVLDGGELFLWLYDDVDTSRTG